MAVKGGKRSSWGLAFSLVAAAAAAQTPSRNLNVVTVVSENQIDTIPVSEVSGVSMVPLAALAGLVGAELKPGSEQAVTLSANGHLARLTEGRNFVSAEESLSS